MVHHEIGSAFGEQFGCGDSKHVRRAGETVREEDGIRISSDRFRQRGKAVNTDRDVRGFRQGDRENWQTNGSEGGLARLIFEAAVGSLFRTGFHTNPQVEAMKYRRVSSYTEIRRCIRMTCM